MWVQKLVVQVTWEELHVTTVKVASKVPEVVHILKYLNKKTFLSK